VESLERDAVPGELCTCGRDAVVVVALHDGEIGWCGLSSELAPVRPCRFCGAREPHRNEWGEMVRCPSYRVFPIVGGSF
jgi:hypothetical protein